MIEYRDSADGLSSRHLIGFFEGWPQPPSPETHLEILRASSHLVVAFDTDEDRAVGFVNAISDGILAAYVPLLEVVPEHRGRGVGTELVRRLLERLGHLYMIDLVCDPDVVPFYERLGMRPLARAMSVRNFERSAGAHA